MIKMCWIGGQCLIWIGFAPTFPLLPMTYKG